MKNYASKSNPHNVKVGDLFSMSWGYDQTNVNYFQVTRVSDSGVWVREIEADPVPGTQGFMCQYVKPAKNCFLDRSHWYVGNVNSGNPEIFRRIQIYQSCFEKEPKVIFNFRSRYFATLCKEDSSTYTSWYA